MGKRKAPVGEVPKDTAAPAHSETEENHNISSSGLSDDSEDEAEEVETPETESKQPPKKKTKKQLSAEDVQIARETAELFKSNIFKLQIEELLKEVKLKDSHITRLEKVLHRLHGLIEQITPIENQTLGQAESHFNHKKTVIPFPDPKPTSLNYTFGYLPPQDISLVGSFGLKAAINERSPTAIDVALTMPQELFQPKDYLNYRALYKRAFYIAYVAEHLIPLSKKNNLPLKITYEFFNDDILNPVLRIESIKTDAEEDLDFHDTGFYINILVGFPFGIFDSKKLSHDRNCIRVQSDDELPPTPLYNSSILSMTAYDHYLKYLYTNKKAAEAFKDACILGRLWLSQRGMSSALSDGGFGHFEFAVLMAALLTGGGTNGNKILLQGFSSYQLFKGTINYLASMDLSKGYLSFSSAVDGGSSSKYVADSEYDYPAIVDRYLKLNILWKMTQSSYERLQFHARETLVLLNDVVKDRFDPILLQKSNIDDLQFDLVLRVSIPEEVQDSFGPLEKITYLTFEAYIKEKVYRILVKALGARANLIYTKMKTKNSKPFQIYKRKPSSNTVSELEIGIKINPEESEKLVTRGPAEDDPEGELFRSFWGSKSSLRRFKDGSIQYCVVWNIGSEPLATSIVKYILDMHLVEGISQHVECAASEFNALLPTPLLPAANNQAPTNLSGFINLASSFERLTKNISDLSLPLGVKAISPASPALRFSSLLQPVPFAIASPDFWNDVVLQFETSTRWPDELAALEKTKTAFLLKIQKELADTAYESHIVKDDSIPFNENVTTLHVLTPEGFGFRIRVLTERDEILYLRAVENADRRKPIAHDVYLKFNRHYLGCVKHTRTVSTLAHHYPFYSSTVRLFKYWLDSQLILQHISEELVELLVLKVFIDSAPYSTPNSVIAGFLQVLSFLSSWNWRDDPLILDLVKKLDLEDSLLKGSDKLTTQAHQVIVLNFDKIRKSDPTGIKTQFFVASKDDPSGILWSNGLTLPIAGRITALSRLALKVFLDKGINKANLDLVFVPGLSDFDFVLNLKSTDLSKDMGVLKGRAFKNLIGVETSFPEDITSKVSLPQILVEELNKKYGNVAIFFARKCNLQDKSVIGGLFLPNILTPKKFKVTVGINVKPISKEEIIINKSAIFDEVSSLAGDLLVLINRKGTQSQT
ncbi:hypothetical protein QFC19_009079 [Naganishia cerealis]|uniref:Uncharacterized protein n=1 Tax=Naganishia cerealis TaxID=610337 RepID=A0ACC2UX58_9TREE|nr:hypothetical protein QFC19_009079 [Naganishia cerealis]